MQNQLPQVPIDEQIEIETRKLMQISKDKGGFNSNDVFLCMSQIAEFVQNHPAAMPGMTFNTEVLANNAAQNFGIFYPQGSENIIRFCLNQSFLTAVASEVYNLAQEEEVADSESESPKDYNLALLREVNALEKKAKDNKVASVEDIQSAFSRLSATVLPTLKIETPTTEDDFARFAFRHFWEESYSTFWRKLTYESIHDSIKKAAKHFSTTNLSVKPFISNADVIDDEFLNSVPDNPLGYVSWAAQRIYKYGQFNVRANTNVIRDEILRLNKLMYPAYETREDFENIMNNNLALTPEIKALELAQFDKEVSELPIKDAASISLMAKNRRELLLSVNTEIMASQMTQNFHTVSVRAIAADVMLSSFYVKYSRAIDLGMSEEKASKLLPTATTLKENATDWLAQLLIADFRTREARGNKPKPEPTEQEKREFKERVIGVIQSFTKRPSNPQIAIKLKMSGNTVRSQTKALERELDRLNLSIEDLRYEARQ